MAATQGIINKQFVSVLDSFLDTREISKNVTDIYNEDGLTDILDFAGKKKPIETGQPFYSNYVNDKIFLQLDLTGSTIVGSGTPIVNFTATVATSGYARKDDLVLTTTGNNSAIITNVTTAAGIDTVFVKSVAGVNLTIAVADKLSIYSVAVGENSTNQANLRFGMTRYFNKYQIFREISKMTDVQKAATIIVDFEGQNYFKVKEHIDKQILLKGHINAAYIAGDMSASSFADVTPLLVDANTDTNGNGGGTVQTTRGMNKYCELYGNNITVATPGTYGQADMDNSVATLLAARAPKEQLVFSSSLAKGAVDTYYKALGSAGVQSVRMVVAGKELDLEVDKVSRSGFKFNYTTMNIMDHPTLFGASDINKSLYFMPFNSKVAIYGGGYADCISTRFIPSQTKNGDGMIDELHGGALAWNGNPTFDGQAMNATCSWVTKQGLEVLGAQFLVKQKVLA